MIYYNLESEYEGDFTKHCGLTIAEADGNFYELETMVMDMKKQKFGQTFFYAGCINETGLRQLLPVEIAGDSTYVVNGTVPYTGDITGLGADYALSFLFENPYFIGASRQVSGLPVFVNNINIGDMAGQGVDLGADCIIECALKPHGDEFIIYIPKFANVNRSTNDDSILKKFRNSEFEIVSTITVDRAFNVRIEKQGLVICDCKIVFGRDFHLETGDDEDEVSLTRIAPDTEFCTPGTMIDAEHQQYTINGHNIEIRTVVDFCEFNNGERVEFDFPQNFDFGFSIVGSKTPDTEEVVKDEWVNIMEQLYPDAEYSAYLVGSESASIPIIHIVDGMFWEHLFNCSGTQNFMTPFTLTVDALHTDRIADIYHTVTLGAFDSKIVYNIGKFYETGFNEMDYSMVFQIRWNDKETEKYTFVFDCTLGKYCQELDVK